MKQILCDECGNVMGPDNEWELEVFGLTPPFSTGVKYDVCHRCIDHFKEELKA